MDVVPLGPGFGAELRGKAYRLRHPASSFKRVPALNRSRGRVSSRQWNSGAP